MLDDEATVKEFGYLASTLKPKSHKKIVYRCSGCHKQGQTLRFAYVDNHLCTRCAGKKRLAIELEAKEEAYIGKTQANFDDQATLELFGYRASFLEPKSNKPIIYICNICQQQTQSARGAVKPNQKCSSCRYRSRAISQIALKQDILKVAKELGHYPSAKEYGEFGKYHPLTVKKHFGKGWLEVLEVIGFKVKSTKYSIKDVETELKRVRTSIGKFPLLTEYQKLANISIYSVRKVLKCTHWSEILIKVFKIDLETAKSCGESTNTYCPTKDLLKKLKDVAQTLGHSPSIKEAQDNGIPTSTLYKRLKTDWAGILQAAGLDIKTLPTKSSLRFIKAQDIILDIREVRNKLGRTPTREEYLANGKFKNKLIDKHFDGWICALKAAKLSLDDLYKNKKNPISRPDSYYFEQLQELAKKLGHSPNCKQARDYGISVKSLHNRFQTTWAEILQAAGLSKSSLPKASKFIATSNQEILADIKKVAKKLGYLPTESQYKAEGQFLTRSIRNRFGKSWKKILGELEEYISLSGKPISTVAKNKENTINSSTINPKAEDKKESNVAEQSVMNISTFFKNSD